MPKKNSTHISILLDRSYSMNSIKTGTISGFNEFLSSQVKEPGTATFTLCQFDHSYEVIYDMVDISQVKERTVENYVPRGNTALLDSLATLITTTGEKLRTMKEADRPSKVIFVIITDGEENSSVKYRGNSKAIQDMINHQRDKYEWEFIFIGANQDALGNASALGMNVMNAMNFEASDAGSMEAWKNVDRGMKGYRLSASSKSENFFGRKV